jgi:protein-disulfide isomerase
MDVGARGTPTFIIGDNVFPGAMEYDQLKKTVDDAATQPPAKTP